jgi:mRNA interferase RelE/StbE
MSKVVIHRRALRYLQRLPQPERERVRAALLRLAEDIVGNPGVIQMAGEWEGYQRIRVGNLRVIFWHDETDDIIYVDHIGPRGDIYKR